MHIASLARPSRIVRGRPFAACLLLSSAISGTACAQAMQATPEAQPAQPVDTPATATTSAASPSTSAPPAAAAVDNSGEIVVTAQRREQKLSQVPISVQAQTGEALLRAGITDSRALERISPSVNFTEGYSPTASTVIIRGVASFGQEGGIQPSTSVVVDGVPTARPAEFVTELSDIDRIEVLSGPQGTLFGKNSTAGVVNIVTKRPNHTLSATAEGSVTTDDQYTARATINTPLNEKFALRVNGYYDYLKPLAKNIFPGQKDDLGLRAYGIQGKLLFDASDSTNFLLTANYNHDVSSFGQSFPILPNSGPLGVFQVATYGDVHFGRTRDLQTNHDGSNQNTAKSYSFTGELNSDFGNGFKLTSVTGYRYFRNDNNNDVDKGPFGGTVDANGVLHRVPNPAGYPIEAFSPPDFLTEIYRYFSQEVRVAYSGGGLDAIIGGYYQNYNEHRFADYAFLFGGLNFSNDAVSSKLGDDTAAVFGDVTYKIVSKFSVFAGLRYTTEKLRLDYGDVLATGKYDAATNVIAYNAPKITSGPTEKRTDNNLSGRVGVQFQPTTALNYYASVNRGYKGPAADESHAAAAIPYGQRLLKPEIATAYEIGAKQRFLDGALALDIALYKQKVHNIQQVASIPNNITQRLINAGDLRVKGVELNARARVSSTLNFEGGFAYTDAKYRGGFFLCNTSQTPGVAPCTIDANGDGIIDTQSLTGRRAIATPKVKYLLATNYDGPLTDALRIFGRVSFTWQSKIQYQLAGDPFTTEPHSDQLDADIGLSGGGGRWEVSIFGKNLTNHLFYQQLNTNDQFISKLNGMLGRDFKRYGGVRGKVNF